MAKLLWDAIGERQYEAGVDRGVLYLPDSNGVYINGKAWNGLINVTEKPSGAESNPQYADNVKYLDLYSAEDFGCSIEAYTYPDEFLQFDGSAVPTPGVTIGQQLRKSFGFSYRSLLGNDVEGEAYGYKIHCVYGAKASPSEKAYQTINDSPEALTFNWEVTTTPRAVEGHRPTAIVVIDSTKVDPATLAELETLLYGDTGVDPSLPTPDAIISMFADGVTIVTPTQPTYNNGTHTLTIPTVTGVTYYVDDEVITSGAHVITADTIVTARPNTGYVFASGVDDDWFFDYS